jgi:hypothetical protein
LDQRDEDASDPIRVKYEFDSNVIGESAEQHAAHSRSRISMLVGIKNNCRESNNISDVSLGQPHGGSAQIFESSTLDI